MRRRRKLARSIGVKLNARQLGTYSPPPAAVMAMTEATKGVLNTTAERQGFSFTTFPGGPGTITFTNATTGNTATIAYPWNNDGSADATTIGKNDLRRWASSLVGASYGFDASAISNPASNSGGHHIACTFPNTFGDVANTIVTCDMASAAAAYQLQAIMFNGSNGVSSPASRSYKIVKNTGFTYATAGTFTITNPATGLTTQPIAYNAAAGTVTTALQGLGGDYAAGSCSGNLLSTVGAGARLALVCGVTGVRDYNDLTFNISGLTLA